MSLRISFRQTLRSTRLLKTLHAAGSSGLYTRQASQSWSPSFYNHIANRLASTTGDTPAAENKKKKSGVSGDNDLVQKFNTQLENGTLTKEKALSYLKKLDIQNRYDTGLGEATIKWMWNQHDTYEFPRDKHLLELTIKHLVKEGKEELAWNWIEQKSRKTGALGPNARFVWRSDTVKALVAAKAFDSDHDSLDGALETFFRASSSSYSIPLAPARMSLGQMLMMPQAKTGVVDTEDVQARLETPRWPNTSTQLWEKFLKTIDRKKDVSEPLHVQLPLYHPGGPHALPYLKHCRHLAKNPDSVKSMTKKPSIGPWIGRGRHAVAVLRQQGLEKDADWLGEFLQELHTKWAPSRQKEMKRKAIKFGRARNR